MRLLTDNGASVELTGNLPEDVTSGSTFSGTLSVPAAVVAAVPAVSAGTGSVEATSETGKAVLSASVALDAALPVVAATIEPQVAQTSVAASHAFDVFVATLPTAPTTSVLDDPGITTLETTLSTYWSSQSSGQIIGFTQPLATKRVISINSCQATIMFTEAAAAFGHTQGWYTSGFNSHHLIILAPASCGAGTGLGSVGRLASGGVVWASYDDLHGTNAVAHEVGHNLGLRHSNKHTCPNPIVEGSSLPGGTFSDGCSDLEYQDFYDVMGGGLSYNGVTNAQLTALNITQKYQLDAINGTDLRPVALAAGVTSGVLNFALNPISDATGVRGLKITDPRDGEVYFVEYRSGTGMDAGSLYASGYIPGMTLGVRVLRQRDDTTSAVLTLPNKDGSRSMALKASQSLTSHSGGLTVKVTSISGTADVTVLLGDAAGASNMGTGAVSIKGQNSELVPGTTVEIRQGDCAGPAVWRTTTGSTPSAYGAFGIGLTPGPYCIVTLAVPAPYGMPSGTTLFRMGAGAGNWVTVWLPGPISGALVAKDAQGFGINGVTALIRQGSCVPQGPGVWENTTATNQWSSGGFGISLIPGTYCTIIVQVPGGYSIPAPTEAIVTAPGPVWITAWIPSQTTH
ncbi:hypothetical protein [Cryobacterium sp. GrIS_2_6]|uniref:hypothetical protein n=1 Tax=Cryobacterium sp. GrIS_2_6 TaxID=3162785 RepID=UPI002DF81E66|nr:hypothetical protein [Cryobacterium psychrotolerans]